MSNFAHLKLWVAVASHNLKWVKILITYLGASKVNGDMDQVSQRLQTPINTGLYLQTYQLYFEYILTMYVDIYQTYQVYVDICQPYES